MIKHIELPRSVAVYSGVLLSESSIRPYCCNEDSMVQATSTASLLRIMAITLIFHQELEFQNDFQMTRDYVLRKWEFVVCLHSRIILKNQFLSKSVPSTGLAEPLLRLQCNAIGRSICSSPHDLLRQRVLTLQFVLCRRTIIRARSRSGWLVSRQMGTGKGRKPQCG
jgi:hypothetical protein